MAEVQKFERTMLEEYLKTANLNYQLDNDGDYTVNFNYDERIGAEVTMYLLTEGEGQQIYVVRTYSTLQVTPDNRANALEVCNEWNATKRWPKIFVFNRDPASAEAAMIVTEQQIDLETGVHQELINTFTNSVLVGTMQFYEWAHAEKGL